MDTFRTELHLAPVKEVISLRDPVLTMGSCFADSLGQKLRSSKFSVSANPFGTIYNPLSIHKLLLQSLHNQPSQEHTFLTSEDIHLNYDFHSEFSATSKHALERKINETIGHTHHFIKSARYLLLTYGTSWAYERLDTGEIVANCHKVPSGQFKKVLLTQKKILESFEELHHILKGFNPDIKIIVTVSPVRHLKDTLELNSVSKSILRLTSHTLTELYPDVTYFPAYEILLDDLRDYRFYSSDLIHPTSDAVDYIWVKFSGSYFDRETKLFVTEWHEILKALSHRPFQPGSQSHQKFLKGLLNKLQELRVKVNVEEEIMYVNSQLVQ